MLARQGRLQGDAERRRAYQESVASLRQSLSHAQVEQSVYADLTAAFGRSGVPAMLIDAAVPHIETEANHLLGRMTDNRLAVKLETQRTSQGGHVTETLDILISDELGSRNYDLFSGGEAFRINLSLRIALSKVLSQRMGVPPAPPCSSTKASAPRTRPAGNASLTPSPPSRTNLKKSSSLPTWTN